MPRVNISIQTAGGQTIVLTEGDKIVKEVVIECNSQRCASRHEQDKPQEVALIDGQPMPEAGIQWMSLILPETSPQYTPMPPNFCSPTCVRDFLVYQYLAPGPRTGTDLPTSLDGPSLAHTAGEGEFVRKTDLPAIADVEASVGSHDVPICGNYKEYVGDGIGCDKEPDHEGNCGKKDGGLSEPTIIGQADGAGE